jgi:tape measure domain-containing protein
MTALTQMIGKGKISAEELRGQLGEALPSAMGIMAKSLGVTTQQLDKMMANGELMAADVLPKFATEMEKATVSRRFVFAKTAFLRLETSSHPATGRRAQ